VEGQRLVGLGRSETLLHACLHLLVGSQPRALSLRDVAQLLRAPGLEAEAVLVAARRWGVEVALARAVGLAVRELDLRADDLGPDAADLAGWADGYVATPRDRLWLRIDEPGSHLPVLEPVATLLELSPGPARRALMQATLRPAPGTWPGPGRRIGQVARRAYRTISTTTGW